MNSKLTSLLHGRGLYALAAACVLAAALGGYFLLGGRAEPETAETGEAVEMPELPVTAPVEEEPVETVTPAVIPEETVPEEPVTVETVPVMDTAPVEAEPPRVVMSPLEGEVVSAFSVDQLVYNAALADWRTHDGMDIAAEEGTDVLAACAGTVVHVSEDVLMGTKGVIRSCISPAQRVARCVRVTYDSTVLYDDMSNGGGIACDIENAIRMDADTADAGARYGIPTLGVVAVGKEMERTEKFFLLATRVLAENGANIVKSYFCDGFERVAAACPVPIVIAGGKKLPELEALEMAYKAIDQGAHGVDMGRNIFQSDCPAGMAQAIGKVVHEGYTAQQAYEVYQEVKNAK